MRSYEVWQFLCGFFRGFSKSPVTSRGLLYSIYREFRGQKMVKQPIGGVC